VALTLGKAFDQALGERRGLVRMASSSVPMDESLAMVSLDLSGRPYTVFDVDWYTAEVGGISVTLIKHFFESFAVQARCNLNIRLLSGGDDHHRAEAIFKAFGRALDAATRIDPRRVGDLPSSKGAL
jgi:imidazoleglycerol-phosphate dehydratase